MPALGERFRAAREARGLSLSDVAEQIRIRSVYLAAIEDENWSAIGAPVYIRGFLRTYARFLGLDPEEVVAEFNAASGKGAAASPVQPAPVQPVGRMTESSSSRNLSPVIWIASLIAVALIAFVVYNELTWHRANGAPQQVAAASAAPSPLPSITGGTAGDGTTDGSPGPSESPSAAPLASPKPLVAKTLEVRLSAPSWLRVTVDGNVSMEGTFPAGTAKQFHGRTAMLRIGNAGGVEILVDGKDVGKLGSSGDVVERSFTL